MKNKEVTSFKEWENKRLNLSYFYTWGCGLRRGRRRPRVLWSQKAF
jgi:hypothetical protein